MAKRAQIINVFISSPGDLFPERAVLREVLNELGQQPYFVNRVKLVPKMYEDTVPAIIGLEPQILVNRYLLPPQSADIFVCMIWLRMGTPTQEDLINPETRLPYQSGTEYELLQAYKSFRRSGRPNLLLYRCIRPEPETLSLPIQPELVQELFARFNQQDGLKGYLKTFDKPEILKKEFQKDLEQLLTRRLSWNYAANTWLRAHYRIWLPLMILCVFLSSVFAYMQIPPYIPPLSLKAADVGGWLFVREKIPGGPNVLETLNPRTGELRPLWPSKQEFQSPTISARLSDYFTPYYSATTHQLAFTATDATGHYSTWIAQVILDPEGWPTLSHIPVELLHQCDTCNELAWSPSGKWLIFPGTDGLYAISPLTHEQRHITFYPYDAWPACSPDGKWLAYQGPHHGIQAVASTDCLPISPSIVQTRFVNDFSYAWHPIWSLDGKELVFTSNIMSNGQLYKVAFSNMSSSYDPDQYIQYTRISASNCGALAWARRQTTGQEITIVSCKDAKPPRDTYGCSLLIQPAITQPDWQTTVSAGTTLWDDLNWMD